MTQKNTFKSVPLSGNENSLYQRRKKKISNDLDPEKYSSRECFEAGHSKGIINEMPVYGLVKTTDRSYKGRQGIAESSEENESSRYHIKFASKHSINKSTKSNLSSWDQGTQGQIRTQEHNENSERDDHQSFSEPSVNDQYSIETELLSKKNQKLKYPITYNEKRRLMSEPVYSRRLSNHQNFGRDDQTACRRSLDCESDMERERNRDDDSSEEYEENYLDTVKAYQNSDDQNEQQNSTNFHEEIEEDGSVSDSFQDRDYDQGAREFDSEDEKTRRGVEEEFFYEWEQGYKKDRTLVYNDSYSNISPQKVEHRNLQCVSGPCSISKPNESSYRSNLKQKKNYTSHSPQRSYRQQAPVLSTTPPSHSLSTSKCETTRLTKSVCDLKRKMDLSQEELNTIQKQVKKSIQEKKPRSEINVEVRDQSTSKTASVGIVVVVVVLKGFPKKRLVASEFVKLETAILHEMDRIPEGAFRPQFFEYTKKRGSLIVVSKSRSSADWLKSVVSTLKPWEGAELTTIERGQESVRWLYISSGDPKLPLTLQQLNLIQTALMEKAEDGEVFEPELLDCFNKHQCLVVVCNDQKTYDWLKDAVQTLEPWENAHLSCIDPTEFDEYNTYKMCISPWDEPNKILYRIECQNDNLCIDSWKIIEFKNKGKTGELTVAVPKHVVKVLREMDFRPFLNLRRVLMQGVGDLKDYWRH